MLSQKQFTRATPHVKFLFVCGLGQSVPPVSLEARRRRWLLVDRTVARSGDLQTSGPKCAGRDTVSVVALFSLNPHAFNGTVAQNRNSVPRASRLHLFFFSFFFNSSIHLWFDFSHAIVLEILVELIVRIHFYIKVIVVAAARKEEKQLFFRYFLFPGC